MLHCKGHLIIIIIHYSCIFTLNGTKLRRSILPEWVIHQRIVNTTIFVTFHGIKIVNISFLFFRRETVPVRVRGLRPSLCQLKRSQEAQSCPHFRQTVQLQSQRLRQVIHTPVKSQKTHEGKKLVKARTKL